MAGAPCLGGQVTEDKEERYWLPPCQRVQEEQRTESRIRKNNCSTAEGVGQTSPGYMLNQVWQGREGRIWTQGTRNKYNEPGRAPPRTGVSRNVTTFPATALLTAVLHAALLTTTLPSAATLPVALPPFMTPHTMMLAAALTTPTVAMPSAALLPTVTLSAVTPRRLLHRLRQ